MKKHIKNYMEAYGNPDYISCVFCGKGAIDIHHIVYRSQGGSDEIENLAPLCREHHDCSHFKKQPYIHKEELFKLINA